MAPIDVGSMAVLGVYKDVGLHAGMETVKDDLKDANDYSQNLKEEMVRLNSVIAIVATTAAGAGLKLLSMFKNAVSSSPYLIGALTKIKTYMELLGWAVTKHLKPILDWLADKIEYLYDWYTDLSDASQSLIMWTGLLGAGFLTLTGMVVGLAFALKGLGFGGLLIALGGVVTWLGTFGASILSSAAFVTALGVALGLVVGLLTVMALDELGILDWFSDLGEGFRDAQDNGNLLADALNLIMTPLSIIGDLILVMVTNKTMEDFWKDMDRVTASAIRMKEALGFERQVANFSMSAVDEEATGTIAVPSDGMYKLHAGEQIVPSGSSQGNGQGGSTSIILDFSGAAISLASGIDLDKFADVVSRKIADTQAWGAY